MKTLFICNDQRITSRSRKMLKIRPELSVHNIGKPRAFMLGKKDDPDDPRLANVGSVALAYIANDHCTL